MVMVHALLRSPSLPQPSPGYTRLEPTADAVMIGLATMGPVVVAFAVDEDFML